MSDAVTLAMDRVYKKFRRGESYDSLRDLVPALFRSLRGGTGAELEAKEFWALHDVSFEVHQGEAFGIIGSNGAGKSTLLKLLSGIMRPTHGRISVNGRLSALIEVGAGFHPDLTGRENVFLNGTILGMSKREIRQKFDEIIEFAGLAEFIDTPVKRYSSGMYARLGFAVAAHVDPDLLIVDEVLSVGDYLFQQKCLDRMTKILTGGATVIFVSHNLHAVSGLCQRSLLLERGRVAALGPTNEVLQHYLARPQQQRAAENPTVEIREVRLRDDHETKTQLESGATAYLDVNLTTLRDCQLAVVIELVDDNFYSIFETDTARLRNDTMHTLRAGEELRVTFELTPHLAPGTYRFNVYAHEYGIGRPFSTWRGAATFFIGASRTVTGRANLYPRLASARVIERPSPAESGDLVFRAAHG